LITGRKYTVPSRVTEKLKKEEENPLEGEIKE
jgi:hypothetical protein